MLSRDGRLHCKQVRSYQHHSKSANTARSTRPSKRTHLWNRNAPAAPCELVALEGAARSVAWRSFSPRLPVAGCGPHSNIFHVRCLITQPKRNKHWHVQLEAREVARTHGRDRKKWEPSRRTPNRAHAHPNGRMLMALVPLRCDASTSVQHVDRACRRFLGVSASTLLQFCNIAIAQLLGDTVDFDANTQINSRYTRS